MQKKLSAIWRIEHWVASWSALHICYEQLYTNKLDNGEEMDKSS